MSAESEWLAAERERYDQRDYRRSLYTNTKDDHPRDEMTGERCRCSSPDAFWSKVAFRSGGPFTPSPVDGRYDPCGVLRESDPAPRWEPPRPERRSEPRIARRSR
jgi:hypothetical protein